MCMCVSGISPFGRLQLEVKYELRRSFKHHLTVLNLPRNSIANDALVLVHFDEIGLAEASPNNPLKVLHAHLEPGYPKDRPEPWILLSCAILGLSHKKRPFGKNGLEGAMEFKSSRIAMRVTRLLWNSRCCYRLAASPRTMLWLDYLTFHWMQPRWIEPSRWYVHLHRKKIWWRRRRQFATWRHLCIHDSQSPCNGSLGLLYHVRQIIQVWEGFWEQINGSFTVLQYLIRFIWWHISCRHLVIIIKRFKCKAVKRTGAASRLIRYSRAVLYAAGCFSFPHWTFILSLKDSKSWKSSVNLHRASFSVLRCTGQIKKRPPLILHVPRLPHMALRH